MVMMRPAGKPYKVAKKVLKNKGVKVRKPVVKTQTKLSGPYLQH